MKLKKIMLLMICAICCLTACSSKKITTYEEINYEEFKQKIENKESFALFVGSHDCTHCDDYKVTLNRLVSEYQIVVYYIDIANMKTDEYSEFKTKINFSSTPTTVFIKDGAEETVYNRIVGALPYSKVVKKFTKAGYIKEK